PVVEEEREPMVDVFDEKDHILVVAELPGVEEANIKTEIKDDILNILAEKGDRKYKKEVLLPSKVETEPITSAYKNGILEIKLKKQGK
ncbi:MAG: Hsp20/alpha crystallin family protein, partial [Candidatus Omnitrophica bacterium]|nr:Hsp20/alpha crystallin family protein [Candidatus Omnitrophota bacterium]